MEPKLKKKNGKRIHDDADESNDPNHPSKKWKSEFFDRDSVTVVPGCEFIRGSYKSDNTLPKTILFKWMRENELAHPTYVTEGSDKKFRCVITIDGINYATDVWEKNKKFAEQGAALAAIKSIGIYNDDKP